MRRIFTLTMFAVLLINLSNAQGRATFEELDPGTGGFWNGSDGSGMFKSGPFTFHNSYNSEWGSWSGFSFTNHTDSVTAGWANQYSSIAGSGVSGSRIYATAYVFGTTRFSLAKPDTISGMYITNNTYAYLSMRNGDDFTKKFGGPEGKDPDYFRLIIDGIGSKGDTSGTVVFYLADFRDEDNSKDYIVRQWTWVDLSSLGEVAEVHFSLQSTDMGMWGMNTPAYFCADNVNGKEIVSGNIQVVKPVKDIVAYPNPFSDVLNIQLSDGSYLTEISDLQGRVVYRSYDKVNESLIIRNLGHLPRGLYLLRLKDEKSEYKTLKIQKH